MATGRLVKRKNKSTSFQTLFDQILCRSDKLYKGSVKSDENILQLLDVLDNCRNKWKSTFIKLYSVLRVQKSEVKRLTNLQAHTQAMFEAEVQKRRRIERSRKSLEHKINMIRQVLLVNDVDSARRHLDAIDLSTNEINQSCNERSVGSSIGHVNTPIDSESVVKKGRNSGRISKKLGRASSVSHTGAARRSATKQELRCASVQKFIRLGTINRLNRPHNFVSRTVLRMEVCSACGRRITFGKASYKCLVCRLVVHPACRQMLIQTCVPPSVPRANFTSQTSGRNLPTPHHISAYIPISPLTQPQTHGYGDPLLSSPTFANRMRSRNISLSLLCPSDQFPRVPALVIHCVNEVMARGMKTVGLYRVSGSEKQVRDLYEKFLRSRSTPSLALIEDIHVVCGCLKLFLRSLEEPLVTYLQRPNFVGASEQYLTNPTKAYDCVLNVLKNLPTPNRHTLSFIMLHLKAVSKTSLCQMGEDNLAKVFGPTLVGYSCPEPQVMQAISETKPQQDVLRLLFSLSDDIYSSFLSDWDNTSENNSETRTNYFTSLTTDMSSSEITPNSHNNNNSRLCDMGGSTRKGFLPNLLSSFRDMSS
ncbi:Rac GTPase-activating protein 1 [Schistosoma bovis]|uniref:Rac GTPase-activating protein 1 n=1 Tax=Schistosoma bovis TaxID=6184 RepID=A0A430QJ52_SCHBO|nr:Rac GTPase-activating protein 1 [Schistosoma bovis]